MSELQLPQNWVEYRPHATVGAVYPDPIRRATPPGQGGSSGSAEPGGSSGRAPPSFVTPSRMGDMGGRTQQAHEQPISFWGDPSLFVKGFGLAMMTPFRTPVGEGYGVQRRHVPGAVTPSYGMIPVR